MVLGIESRALPMVVGLVQQFRALLDLAEDLRSVCSTHVVAHNHPQLQFQGVRHPLLNSFSTRHASGVQINIYADEVLENIRLKI